MVLKLDGVSSRSRRPSRSRSAVGELEPSGRTGRPSVGEYAFIQVGFDALRSEAVERGADARFVDRRRAPSCRSRGELERPIGYRRLREDEVFGFLHVRSRQQRLDGSKWKVRRVGNDAIQPPSKLRGDLSQPAYWSLVADDRLDEGATFTREHQVARVDAMAGMRGERGSAWHYDGADLQGVEPFRRIAVIADRWIRHGFGLRDQEAAG